MKAAFNILPEKNGSAAMHLLIEAGSYGISFTWFAKEPLMIIGVAVYNFINKTMPGEIAAEIENILRSNPIFNEPAVSTTLCYDFKESILIPADHYDIATAGDMLNLVHNPVSLYEIKTDRVSSNDIFNVYAVDKNIAAALSRKFPSRNSI